MILPTNRMWCFVVETLIKDEVLLLHMVDQEDVENLREDLKFMQLAGPDMIGAVMSKEWILWLVLKKERPKKGEKFTIAEILCYFMQMFGEAARMHNEGQSVH